MFGLNHLFLLLLICFGSCYGKEKNENIYYELDTLIVKNINVTLPNKKDKLIYHLLVTDWHRPVNWSMFIISNNDTLLQKYQYDKKIDAFFNETDYLGNACYNYLDCKKQWYLHEILNINIDTLDLDDNVRRKLFKNYSRILSEKEPEKFYGTMSASINNWSSYWNYYSDKPIIVFSISYAPEGDSTPLLSYHPRLNKFIPIYQP